MSLYRANGYSTISDDTTKPTITNVWFDPHNHTELMLKATASDNIGVSAVQAYYKRKDKSEWHSAAMELQPNGEWWLCIKAKEADGYGEYEIGVYVYDAAGNQDARGLTTGFDTDIPTFNKVWIDPHNHTELMLKADVADTSGVSAVQAYYKRKDKSEWHSAAMELQPNGEWWLYIKAEAADGYGEYDIHVYAYDHAGHERGYPLTTAFDLDKKAKAAGQTIADGDYHILSTFTKNKGLDVAGGSREPGANVQIYENLDDPGQVFHVEHLGDGNYKITNKASGLSLDVLGGNNAAGTNVQMYRYNGSEAQQWIISEAGNGYDYCLYSKSNGLALDVQGAAGSNGANVQMWTPNGSEAQKWHFIRCGEGSGRTVPDGDYHIISRLDPSKGLDVQGASPDDGANVSIYPNTKDKNQVFHVEYVGNGYYEIRNRYTGTYLSLPASNPYKGTNIVTSQYYGNQSQKWVVQKPGDSPYYNIVAGNGGAYLDVEGGSTADGANVRAWANNGTKAQEWLFIPEEPQKLEASTRELRASLSWDALSWAEAYDLTITDAAGQDFSRKGLAGTGYTCELPEGSYTAYVTGRSSLYSLDSGKVTFTTERPAEEPSLGDIRFEGATYPYDGTARSLAVRQELPEGISVEYEGNGRKDAGSYTVTARFTDRTGKVADVRSAELVITPKDCKGVSIAPVPARPYSGAEIRPELEVKDGQAPLEEGVDYTVEYRDNIRAGNATGTVTFLGNYTGTREVAFAITKAANSWEKGLACADTTYGTALRPEAKPAYGEAAYLYAAEETGAYSEEAPTEAGTYYAKAVVKGSADYAALESGPVLVRIKKAAYDMGGVSFRDGSFVYDGEEKSLEVSGRLPFGVHASYEGNGKSEAGEYTVTAKFGGDSNHEAVPEMTAKLTIKPQEVALPEAYNDLVYNGEEQYGFWDEEWYTVLSGGSATDAGEHEAVLRLNDKKNYVWEDGTTTDKTVAWAISGSSNEWTKGLSCRDISYGQTPEPLAEAKYGKVLYTYSPDAYGAFTSEVPRKAGTYYVRAQVKETEEYTGLFDITTFTIKKAAYDMGGVRFEDATVTYDGRLRSITAEGRLPEGVSVSYSGNGKSDAGAYKVTATFTGDSDHEEIPAREAVLTILPKGADGLTVGTIRDRVYSGYAQEPEVDVLDGSIPLSRGTDYDVSYKENRDAGTAAAVISMKGNYKGEKEVPFRIRQAKNQWKAELTCEDAAYGESPAPKAEARFGEVEYLFSGKADGSYSRTAPSVPGTWYVKAAVGESRDYGALESEAVEFVIKGHDHAWGSWSVAKEASCTGEGIRQASCSICGEVKEEPIPAKGHTAAQDPAVAPTKNSTGLTAGSHCVVCGEILKAQEVVPKKGGSQGQEGEPGPGTGKKEGGAQGAPDSQEGAGHPAVEEQERSITGQKGDGDPKGSSYGKLCARVEKSTKNANTLTWNKVKGATGYIIYGNRCGKGYRFKKLAEVKGKSFKHKKLKKGTYYKYLVVAYKEASGRKKVLSSSKTIHAATSGGKAGNCRKITVNRGRVTLKQKKTFTIKAKEVAVSGKVKIRRHRKTAFESSDPKVATVTAGGKVKAVKKGSCKIYVYAQNGIYKTVSVKVK